MEQHISEIVRLLKSINIGIDIILIALGIILGFEIYRLFKP